MAYFEVNNIVKNYGKNKVLDDVSFSLEKGEILSIIGLSGDGKTTLLRVLNELVTADNGNVIVDGDEVINSNNKTKRNSIGVNRSIGLVFQNFNLFPQYSAIDNIIMPLTVLEEKRKLENLPSLVNGYIYTYALDLLKKVGLEHKKDLYPHELSGGQQQRVAIARAVALKPKVLCFDEPTSALDPTTIKDVTNLIKEINELEKNVTIIVTHDISFARNISDKVLYLKQGKVAEFADVDEFFNHPKSNELIEFLSLINSGDENE